MGAQPGRVSSDWLSLACLLCPLVDAVYLYMQDGGVEATGVLVPVADEMNELESELEMVKTLLQDLQSQ